MSLKHLIVVAIVLAAGARRADAYPQFQLATGAETCKECHYSPAGGGLINDYGRDEAGSTLSMWDVGSGGFLHGAWDPPASFQIGGDLRFVACCFEQKPDTGFETVVFPMQMELYVRPKIGPVSLYAVAGVMPARDGILIPASREHYAMYEDDGGQWYVRAGRFYPIYGIRSQDHTSFVRRPLQMYLYEEPYGAAWGKYFTSAELHVSAFTRYGEALFSQNHDNGVAAYYEKRNDDATGAYAAQTKLTFSDTDRRAWVGGVYKRWMEGAKLMFLGETDVGVQAFPAVEGIGTPAPLYELVAYANATYYAKEGLLVGGTLQHFDPDLAHRATARDGADVDVQWFPIPHLEVHSLLRLEVEAVDVSRPIVLGMIQLHYYL